MGVNGGAILLTKRGLAFCRTHRNEIVEYAKSSDLNARTNSAHYTHR
jgi:hypothetical protein